MVRLRNKFTKFGWFCIATVATFCTSANAETLYGVCSITVIAEQRHSLVHYFEYSSTGANVSQGFAFGIPGLPYSCLHKVHDLNSGTWLRCNYEDDFWLSDRTSFEEKEPRQDMRVKHSGNFFAVQSVCNQAETK